jgi:hypothetical protein
MNINSEHHNLLGNQISPKSEDFCIWQPFCTLVTMATVAILNFSNPQKLPHTTVDIPTKWIIIWLPNHGYQFPTSKFTWKPNIAQIGGFLYLAVILYLGYHGNGRHFEFFQPPSKAATYYGGYSYKVDHMAPKPWISIPNIKIYLEAKFRPNRRIFAFWWPF